MIQEFLVRKPKGKRLHGGQLRIWDDNIKITFENVKWVSWTGYFGWCPE